MSYFDGPTGLPGDVEQGLIQQLMNMERLFPNMMGMMEPGRIGVPSEIPGWPMVEINNPQNPGQRIPMSYSLSVRGPNNSSSDFFRLPGNNLEAMHDVIGSDIFDIDGWKVDIDRSPRVTPLDISLEQYSDLMRDRLRRGMNPVMQNRMWSHARSMSPGDPTAYVDDILSKGEYPRFVSELADSALHLADPGDRASVSNQMFKDSGLDDDIRNTGRILNRMKSEGFRGATNLRGAAGMAGIPLALLAPQFGIPTPVARTVGGALAGGSLFGVPGAIGGGALGLLASRVDDDSLLGQMLGSVV